MSQIRHLGGCVMKKFSMHDLSRKIGTVTKAASKAPIMITKNNHPLYVMMSLQTFNRLNPQRVYAVDNTPPEIAAWLLPQLDAIARGESGNDD
jgi:PHD/YefM family antitoxin component YafN of YafNO toxin-antitoxin module